MFKPFDFEDDIAHVEKAPKQVQYTITPIGGKEQLLVWKANQHRENLAMLARREAVFQKAKQRAIDKFMEADKKQEAPSAEQKSEYEYRNTRLKYLQYMENKIGHTNNQVMCRKCKSIGIVNYALGKEFYFCKECRQEC